MDFTKINESFMFADLAMTGSLEHNPVCMRTRTGEASICQYTIT